MIPYYVIYALVLAGIPICLIDDIQVRKNAQYIYFSFIVLALTVFAGVRSSHVDRDYANYIIWFNEIANGSANQMWWMRDPPFALLSYAISKIGLSFSAVAVTYAFIGLISTINLVVLTVSSRWSILYFYLFFCQYFIVGEMTEIRSAVAIPLMLTSLYYACEKRWPRSVFFLVIALLFHLSVLIVLPILILLFIGVRYRTRIWLIFLLAIWALATMGMSRVVDSFSNFYRISEYIHGVDSSSDRVVVSWYVIAHLLTIAVCITLLWKKLSLHQRMATICCGSGIMLYQIFVTYKTLAIRLLYPFDLCWILLLIVFMERLQGNKRLLYAGILVAAGFIFYIQSVQYLVEPYSTIFD